MAEDFDKTQKIAKPTKKPKKRIANLSFFSHSRRDVDREISRTQLIRDKKMEEAAGELHADMGQLYPQLPQDGDFYEHDKILGEGGQGIVFRATDKSLERVVAVKSLRAELLDDPQARKSFLAEAKITAQLEHPSVVPIYSLTGDDKNGLHLAMKMLRGMTLATYLNETCRHYREEGIRRYDEDQALRYRLELFLRACDALSYAHSRNLMHRDLKPGNIIIGEYREVYLIDWGIATPIRTEHPDEQANSLGTPPFMAPEVVLGEPGDQRADIFALGAILFDIVFLKPAFAGNSPEELIAKVVHSECNSFRHAFGAHVSRELVAIVQKAMATSKEERYQTVEELSSDLRSHLVNEETTALPDGFFGKISRAMAKHRRLVAAVVGLILFSFLGHTAWSFYRQRNAEIAQRQYEHAVAQFSDKSAMVAYQIEQKLGALESLMKEFTAEAAARLEFPPLENAPEPVEFIPKGQVHYPADAHYSSYYEHWLRIDHCACRLAAKELDEMRAKREIAQLTPAMEKVVPRFLQIGSLLPDDKKSLPILKEEMLRDGNMMLWFYFGSPAGFLLQYPGSDALPDDYDPRDRGWFVQGKSFPDDRIHWSKPYLGLQVKKLMMTCIQSCRKGDKLLGVGALDVTLDRFREIMNQYGADASFTDARLLLDADGMILVSADSGNKTVRETDPGKPIKIQSSAYASLYRQAAKKGFGDTVGVVNGKRKLFLCFPVHKMKWFYAEVIDLDRALLTRP